MYAKFAAVIAMTRGSPKEAGSGACPELFARRAPGFGVRVFLGV